MRNVRKVVVSSVSLMALALSLALVGCGSATNVGATSGGSSGNDAALEQASNDAESVMDEATSILNKNELGMDGSTPQTIESSKYPDLFKQVAEETGVTIDECTLTCDVETIVSETVRGTHNAYTYSVKSMDAKLNGVAVHYDKDSGYSIK